jgi:predicted enzyme related to lactoylglutathione lyase
VVEAGPRQAGEYGHFAVARDPGGAAFSIWQAGTHFGSRNGHVLGRHCWTELATREVAACKEFYARVFGWDAHVGEMGGVEYVSFLRQGAPVGGLWGMAAGREEDAPEWGVYFSVVNAEAAAEATVAGGGAVVSGPREIAGVGMAAALRDAQGACFHVIALKAR